MDNNAYLLRCTSTGQGLLIDAANDAGGRLAGSPHVFTGDSLFPGGVGKTNSPEDFTSLLTDVTERLFGPLPDATWVYPGHGNDTTLGTERPHLGEWRERGW